MAQSLKWPFLRLVVPAALLFSLLLSPAASAQLTRIDEVGKQFAKKFKQLKPSPAIVNVADFSFGGSALAQQSHYLAWYLAGSLSFRGKDFLLVPNHQEFDKNLTTIKNSPQSTLSPEDFSQLSTKIGGDFLVLGTLEKNDSSFVLKLSALRVSDGTVVDSEKVELRSSEFLESLSIPLQPLSRVGVNGIGMPSCPNAPDPSYTDLARGNKVNGTALMEANISAEGTIQQIHPVKLLGYGLDEQAFNTLKTWKCKPALDVNGNPVAVTTPVEFTFRLN